MLYLFCFVLPYFEVVFANGVFVFRGVLPIVLCCGCMLAYGCVMGCFLVLFLPVVCPYVESVLSARMTVWDCSVTQNMTLQYCHMY
jgi:hypothetical protein